MSEEKKLWYMYHFLVESKPYEKIDLLITTSINIYQTKKKEKYPNNNENMLFWNKNPLILGRKGTLNSLGNSLGWGEGGLWGHKISRGNEKNKMWKFHGSIKGIFKGDPEKIMQNFHESWMWVLEVARGVTQFLEILGVKLHFCLEFLGVK